MKNKKQLEKKYVDELKDEYDRIGEIRGNRMTVGCLVTVVLILFLLALKYAHSSLIYIHSVMHSGFFLFS